MRTIGFGVMGVFLAACGGDQFAAATADNAPSVTGSTSDSGETDSATDGGRSLVDAQMGPQCDGTKLPTEDACVVTEAAGVFVSSSRGNDAMADGSRAKPFASLAKAIPAAKQANRRVYACAETFAENVDFVQGVSMFGYFDCASSTWGVTSAHAQITPPASPATTASNIASDTRIEAFDIIAPNVTTPSGSSIGLLANSAGALHLVNAKIHAGTAGKGADGALAIQLTDSQYKDGATGEGEAPACVPHGVFSCYFKPRPPSGVNTCFGESGHDPSAGGSGGSGGNATAILGGGLAAWSNMTPATAGMPLASSPQTAMGGAVATHGTAGADGASGTNGTVGNSVGAFSATGYTPSDGTAGTAGSPGQSGGGGGGQTPGQLKTPLGYYQDNGNAPVLVNGSSGGGGGAGGCPGLASGAGAGGGASVGIVAVMSALTLENMTIETSAGGDAGKATYSSAPTTFGNGGSGALVNGQWLSGNGGRGGNGGGAGASGNGGGGPSIALAYSQAAAPRLIATTLTPAAGGAGASIPKQIGKPSSADSPAGLSRDKYSF